jgi:hypothetical protein
MSTEMSRRDFAKAAACASVAALSGGCSRAESEVAQAQTAQDPASQPSTGPEFPKASFNTMPAGCWASMSHIAC